MPDQPHETPAGRPPTIAPVGARLSRTRRLADGVDTLRFVTLARQQALARLGIRRVRDLLLHVPHRYLDFSHVTPIGLATVGQEATVVGTVDKVSLKFPRPRMQVVEVYVVDDTGVIEATFFRQPWIAKELMRGDRVALSGKVTFAYGFKQMRAPFHEVLGKAGEEAAGATYARVLPVHPVGEGISAPWMRRIVSAALASVGDMCDPVPAALLASHGLMGLGRALREVHFPQTLASAEEARRRLAYDELLCLQIALLARQSMRVAGVESTVHQVEGPSLAALREALPFSLTEEQEGAASQILADMAAPQVMNRLLLGDVGTGKTAVAAVALAAVADTGTQAAMMAPTSVLARQYSEKLGPLLDTAGITWRLVTGATPTDERAEAEAGIASGAVTVAFGTTALLSEGVSFARLSLVVIDEQHRFGVNQRAALREKGAGADLLAMTATPIPRTLALSLYGDLSLSRIAHRPRPGAGVATKVVAPSSEDLAWAGVREAVEAGHQAYVVCPLVDEADTGEGLDEVPEADQAKARQLHAATTTLDRLGKGALRGLRLGLLTGRMSAADKDEAMDRFRAGQVDVLVCTTVVEVGVDVPNATAMVVLDSDRFGLATLHQLRGRVGRGDVAGQVWLVCAAKKGSPARERLAALERTSDGFELAELDLRLRREGELLGYRQSGEASLAIADLFADADLVEAAHEDALALVAEDPGLEADAHAGLALEARDRFGAYFEEVERA